MTNAINNFSVNNLDNTSSEKSPTKLNSMISNPMLAKRGIII